jgi:glycerate kinase
MEFHNPFVGIQFDPSMFGPQHQKIVAEVNMLHATIKKEQQKTEQSRSLIIVQSDPRATTSGESMIHTYFCQTGTYVQSIIG